MYLNTNTVFSILNIHKIHLKLAIQWSNTIKVCLHPRAVIIKITILVYSKYTKQLFHLSLNAQAL